MSLAPSSIASRRLGRLVIFAFVAQNEGAPQRNPCEIQRRRAKQPKLDLLDKAELVRKCLARIRLKRHGRPQNGHGNGDFAPMCHAQGMHEFDWHKGQHGQNQ